MLIDAMKKTGVIDPMGSCHLQEATTKLSIFSVVKEKKRIDSYCLFVIVR